MTKIKGAIIFDMDGVISDSMPFHAMAWKEAFASIGVSVDDFDVYIREGMKGRETIEGIMKERNMSISQEEMEQIYKKKTDAFNREFEVRFMPGICELLTGLRNNGYSLGLVTGSRLAMAKAVLQNGLEDMFDVVIAGELVTNGKPDPEPYLKAVSMLGVGKGDCLVIENAPAGITSAKRAGLTCYAVATSLPETYLKEADKVFKSIEEVSALLLSGKGTSTPFSDKKVTQH